jgi:hypothetical protein
MIPDPEKIQRGNMLVRSGWLAEMREATGISRNHLAGLLKSHGNHVRKWESGSAFDDGGPKWIHHKSALRIADLHDAYLAADEWLATEGLTWDQLLPIRVAASLLGIATATLRLRMIAKQLEPIDFGSLGEWVVRDEAALCRR